MEITSGIHTLRFICRKAVLYTKRIIAAVYTVSVLMFFTFFGANVYRSRHYNYRSCQKVENRTKMRYDIIIKL